MARGIFALQVLPDTGTGSASGKNTGTARGTGSGTGSHNYGNTPSVSESDATHASVTGSASDSSALTDNCQ